MTIGKQKKKIKHKKIKRLYNKEIVIWTKIYNWFTNFYYRFEKKSQTNKLKGRSKLRNLMTGLREFLYLRYLQFHVLKNKTQDLNQDDKNYV